jgi:hypothetical protein
MRTKKVEIGLVAAGLLGACAHQQPTAVSEQKPPVPAEAAAAAPTPPACPPGMPCERKTTQFYRDVKRLLR